MIDLGNGQYQISNKRTGETKTVTADQLPQYGLSAPQKPDPIPGIVKAGVPTGLGLAMGTIGSVGGPVGTLSMGGLGASAGQALINLLERALGGPTPQTVEENTKSLRNAAAMQMVGEGAGRAVGFAANPIRALSGKVASEIAASTKGINLDALLSMFRGEAGQAGMAPLTKVGANQGMGVEAQAAYDAMLPKIKEVVDTAHPYLGSMSDVPVQTAQHLKQTIPSWGNVLAKPGENGAAAMYSGKVVNPGLSVPKEFNALLKAKIEEAVPGVKIPNKLMHYLYTLPNLLESLTYGLPWAAGRSLRAGAGAVAHIPGAVIPESGGMLKYLLQLGGQGAQQTINQPQ